MPGKSSLTREFSPLTDLAPRDSCPQILYPAGGDAPDAAADRAGADQLSWPVAGERPRPTLAYEQDIEATLHCIRFSGEAVSLNEDTLLPILFGENILGQLAQRPLQGKGEERLRLTVVCMIRESSSSRSR